jgi:hypothetical protein
MTAGDGSGLRHQDDDDRFLILPRATVRDDRLSFRARGLLAFLADQPAGWDVRATWLETQGTEGREAIYSALRELRVAGYYRVERRRRPDGTFTMGTAVSKKPVARWAEEGVAQEAARLAKREAATPVVAVLADGSVVDVDPHDDLPPTDGDRATPPTDLRQPVGREPDVREADDREPCAPTEDRGRRSETESGPTRGVSLASRGADLEAPSTPAAAPSAPAAPDGDVLGPPPVRSCRRWPAPHGACGACAADREALAAWEAAAHRDALDRAWAAAEAERRRRDDARALAAAQLRACRLCDQDGLLPSGLRCLHDPDANPRVGEGGRAAWAKAREDLAARRPRADTRPRRRDGGRRQAG